jgi:type III secretory pathway component EscS
MIEETNWEIILMVPRSYTVLLLTLILLVSALSLQAVIELFFSFLGAVAKLQIVTISFTGRLHPL